MSSCREDSRRKPFGVGDSHVRAVAAIAVLAWPSNDLV